MNFAHHTVGLSSDAHIQLMYRYTQMHTTQTVIPKDTKAPERMVRDSGCYDALHMHRSHVH